MPDNPSPNRPPDEPSCEKAEELRQTLWEEFGLAPPAYRNESLAPEVDRDLLQKLVRRELPDKTARVVYWLVYSFRSWTDAHAEIVVSEFRRTQDESQK